MWSGAVSDTSANPVRSDDADTSASPRTAAVFVTGPSWTLITRSKMSVGRGTSGSRPVALKVSANLPAATLALPPTACMDPASAVPPSLAVMAMAPPSLLTVRVRETVAPPAVTASTSNCPLAPSALITEPGRNSTAVPTVARAADAILTLPPASTTPRAGPAPVGCSTTVPDTSSTPADPNSSVPATGSVVWLAETIARLRVPPDAYTRPSARRFRPARRLMVASGSATMFVPASSVRSPAGVAA